MIAVLHPPRCVELQAAASRGPRPVSVALEPSLRCNGVPVVDTFAEAFPMAAARLIVTAVNERWARTAAEVFCGYATSVIACDLEASIERAWTPEETPDGRPGFSLLAFAFSRDKLAAALANRVGQCLLTCPTTACYNALEAAPDRRVSVGEQLRFFGDGYQSSKVIGTRRFWRIPVMDGEFLCEDRFGTARGVAGGNLLIGAGTQTAALQAAECAVDSIRRMEGVALPFPGGIVRSGSKVGSRYRGLPASTNEAYCPTLRPRVSSALPDDVHAVYEIVIDGLTPELVSEAMRRGLHTATAAPGVRLVTAGNYGGKLGPHHFALRDLLTPPAAGN
jgi:formylmethanofuran--tetrahydromethanopterin N-formyltransferase